MMFALDRELFRKLEKWLETLLFTAIVLGGGYVFNRSDPFFVHAQFPWLWFAPLMLALLHGIAPGLVSVLIICISCLALQHLGMLTGEFPTNYMLGGVLLTLISGQFSTLWNQRLRRSDLLSSHASERFEQLSQAYFMVRLSHDRLEQNLISRPVTLRDAMLELRKLLATHGGKLDKEICSSIIAILVHYCSIESAAVYLTGKGGRLAEKPVAECGRGAPFVADDLLLRSAVESGNTAYQSVNRLGREERSSYLVAAPLRTSNGIMKGMLLVSEMPFMALHRETLQIMGVLLAYTADHAEAAKNAGSLLAAFPDCPTIFAAELVKMVRLRRELDVGSALVVVNILPSPRLEELCIALDRQQRGLDHGWRRNLGWGAQFVTLMPFSGPAAVDGFQARLNDMLFKQFGLAAGQGGISTHATMVAADEPLNQLLDLLSENR